MLSQHQQVISGPRVCAALCPHFPFPKTPMHCSLLTVNPGKCPKQYLGSTIDPIPGATCHLSSLNDGPWEIDRSGWVSLMLEVEKGFAVWWLICALGGTWPGTSWQGTSMVAPQNWEHEDLRAVLSLVFCPFWSWWLWCSYSCWGEFCRTLLLFSYTWVWSEPLGPLQDLVCGPPFVPHYVPHWRCKGGCHWCLLNWPRVTSLQDTGSGRCDLRLPKCHPELYL